MAKLGKEIQKTEVPEREERERVFVLPKTEPKFEPTKLPEKEKVYR